MSPPVALNNGQQVDFLLSRIAGAYLQLQSFDDLPTPFRCVAVDLVTAQPVVLDRGSLPDAMRATMSLPGIFPPMEIDGRVLVDGGAMNNVPADVVRAMGSDVVIAINVGFMGEKRTVNYSLMGLMGQTVDVMMQASTRRAMQAADIVINPSLEEFASLDWRRNEALADAGYKAAEAMKDKLLPLALDDAAWAAYRGGAPRAEEVGAGARRQFLSIVGAVDRRSASHRAGAEAARRPAARRRGPRVRPRDVHRARSLRDGRVAADHRGRAARAADPGAPEDATRRRS